MIRLARVSSASFKSSRPALVDLLRNRIVLASRARALSTAGAPGSIPEGDGIDGPLISDKGLQAIEATSSLKNEPRWRYHRGVPDLRQELPTYVRDLGKPVLADPLVNKGTAFLWSERERFHLRGLLPARMVTMEEQTAKVLEEYREGAWDKAARDPNDEMVSAGLTPDNIRKWEYLTGIQGQNETLYYRVLMDNFAEMASVVYTPTVGWACLNFSRMFRVARGMYFSSRDKGHMVSIAYNWPSHEVDAIVVTDGSRILGLGDLGMNGMGISIGKLDLYVAAAGFHPARVLPCVIDVGTNNPKLRKDKSYLGLNQPRIEGDEYLQVVDEFVAAVKARWPNVLIQFEDFRTEYAYKLLERYRYDHLCFNDDIQGTAATALAGIYAGLAAIGKPYSDIRHMRFVVCGAGSAGMGVIQWLCKAMEKHGADHDEAARNFWILDADGLLTEARVSSVDKLTQRFARPAADGEMADGAGVEEVVTKVRPDVLLGLSGAGRIWSPKTIEALAEGTERPLIFPMSNPSHKSECSAEDAAKYAKGRGIFASGSPFEDAAFDGKVLPSNQSNNLYVFPGLALGAKLCQATLVTDGMIMAASEALAACNRPEDLAKGRIYPGLSDVRSISARVAAAVMKQAHLEGVATRKEAIAAIEKDLRAFGDDTEQDGDARDSEEGEDDMKTFLYKYVLNEMYFPVYTPLAYVPRGVLE
uniref:Malate dehydrogenase n=1 Tax=Saccharina japonica TaxID=88149 RepID=A0A0A0V8F1_SACJA|nr:malate dehydrogenase [Saccharina japonica]